MIKMCAATRSTLTTEEEHALHELSLVNSASRLTKLRALAVRLNTSGRSALHHKG